MIQNQNDWKQKKVLITGGTSGLGKALAKDLTNLGAQVAVIARHREGLARIQSELPSVHIIQGDISKQYETHRIYAESLEKLGGIDILVNNASTLGPTPLRLLLDLDCEDFANVLETNLIGPFRLSKLVVPSMILKHSGLIINISSDAAVQNYPTWGAYSISKSALDHMTRIFQAELEGTGVRFLAVDPGDMKTPMHFAAIPDANPANLHIPEDSSRLLIQLIESGKFTAEHRGLR
jgi:NAD(P)-dependent dehydrogenase (short-subunit alcohol dehydrogenase family)